MPVFFRRTAMVCCCCCYFWPIHTEKDSPRSQKLLFKQNKRQSSISKEFWDGQQFAVSRLLLPRPIVGYEDLKNHVSASISYDKDRSQKDAERSITRWLSATLFPDGHGQAKSNARQTEILQHWLTLTVFKRKNCFLGEKKHLFAHFCTILVNSGRILRIFAFSCIVVHNFAFDFSKHRQKKKTAK